MSGRGGVRRRCGAAPVWMAVLAAAATATGSAPLAAQTGPEAPSAAGEPAPMRLTLEEALDYASGSNPQLRQARNRTSLNPVESRALWLDRLLPSPSLTLFDTRFTGNLQRRALDNFGNPIANPSAEWNYFSGTTHRLGLNWSFQGPSLLQAHRTQQLTNRERELEARGARTEVEVEVQRLYMDALEQRELLRAEEALIEARLVDLDVAERLFGLALRTRVDVLSAELEVEQQRLARQRQEAAYRRALLALRTAMGLSEERELALVDEALPLFDPTGLEAGALLSRAREVNPGLLRSEVAIRSGEVALARQDADWWPQVDLGISVYRQAYEPYGEALFDARLASELESQFYVRFSLPIFDGYFSHRVDRRQAAVDLENSREAHREARLELEESIRGALLDLENQWASVRLSERSLAIAEEALRLAREEYRLGSRSFAELRDAFDQEASIRRDAITARHDFVDALLTLEAAVGASVRGAGSAGPGEGSAAEPGEG